MIYELIILGMLLFFSALFSGSETALLSLDSIKIKRIQKQSKNTNYLLKLISNPSRFLTTILIGNLIVNISLSALLTSILIRNFPDRGLAIAIGASTCLLLIFGELTPKTLGIKQAEGFSIHIARPLEIFARIIYPFRKILNTLSRFFIKIIGIRLEKQEPLTQEELGSILELSHRHGVVKENEKEMIRSVLELTRTTAQEIMTPRPDINAVAEKLTQQEILDYLKKVKHSKIPVYKGTIDSITGVLYAKDLFLFPDKDFKSLIKPAIFVPETIKIDELLKDFQSQNAKIAIVVDEYGNTYGLVTLEDILEEIVGEIYDEFESPEEFVQKLEKKIYRISGKAPVDIVKKELHLKIPQGDYETIAGYLTFLFEKIPREGECVEKGGFSFCVEKMAGKRIKSIILKKL